MTFPVSARMSKLLPLFEPDLVVLSNPTIQEELELLGIDVFVAAAAVDLEEVYSQISRNWRSLETQMEHRYLSIR